MGMFSRRQKQPTTAGPGANVATSHETKHHKGPMVLSMSKRPSFGQWLKVTWLDIVTMAAMGAVGLGVYEAHPAPSRSFPVYFQDGEVVYPQFAYFQSRPFFIVQIRVRSFWDMNNAVIGLLYSLITAAVFQVFLKWLIGGLRPHFLTVCKPNIPVTTAQETGNGLNYIMYDRTICTGDEDEIDDSLESFPSGHSTAAFAGFVFLSLYLNAKLKVWWNYHPAMWKLIVTWAPILGATLIAGALTIDEYHNWYDCLAGAIIGTVMAFSSYRMVYASIWDWRTNHIPLNRSTPFPGTGAGAELEDATFTRQVGLGTEGYGASGFGGAGGYGHRNGHHSGLNEGIVQGGDISNKEFTNSSGIGRKPVGTGIGHHNGDPANIV
ncbi:hypothetical protein DID88_005613 [Monilinia fructigena]|uniref:Phosphatidic acid phosphatase type 2/haloperoxidase domain-containing protein n=1 Tax=Monilinia fructigena TaxID=38457 RepID=A0A395J0C2_9HELO|nr:hypothetical protein DID88_005613 [Monilinia fructigena]